GGSDVTLIQVLRRVDHEASIGHLGSRRQTSQQARALAEPRVHGHVYAVEDIRLSAVVARLRNQIERLAELLRPDVVQPAYAVSADAPGQARVGRGGDTELIVVCRRNERVVGQL